MLQAYDKIGYDGINIGNYELLTGIKYLIDSQNKYPSLSFLSANIKSKSTNEFIFNPYKIVKRGSLNIGVIGVTNMVPDTMSTIKVDDYIKAGNDQINKIKDKVDIVVMLVNSDKSTHNSLPDKFKNADYIFLDTYERKKFAQMNHRYLIEQVQYNEKESFPSNTTDRKFKLDFNLPVKSIYWVVQLEKTKRDNDIFNFSDTVNYNVTKGDPITKAVLQMNGSERFEEREAKYFRLIQPFQKHTTVPNDFIYMYSFALKPENYQPSGACNFSKIDNTNLSLTFKSGLENGNVKVYALNYNILRIFSGMGGLAFSN